MINGHHRRPALKSLLPAITGADSRSPTASPAESTPSQKSPFAASASEQPFGAVAEADGTSCKLRLHLMSFTMSAFDPDSPAHEAMMKACDPIP